VATDKDDQDNFLIESMDADDEMSQNAVTSSGNLNSAPFNSGAQSEERWANGEAKRAERHQDRRELQPRNKQAAPGVEKLLETNPQKPSQCFCSIMFSPEVRIPRKQKPKEGCKVPLDEPHTDQVAGKAAKEVGELCASGQLIHSSGLLVAHSCHLLFFFLMSKVISTQKRLTYCDTRLFW